MTLEIERKFLVLRKPDLSAARRMPVRQGYLTKPQDSTELRLRQKGDRCYLTLKGGGDLVRVEREAEITEAQFTTFWPETEGRRIEKERYSGTLSDQHEFELDVFSGALSPLVLVEVEFTTPEDAMAFTPPGWFGREVTEDSRYKNKNLAIDGLPE